LLEDYPDITKVLLDSTCFGEMDLMKDLWKIIRGKEVYFLKYQTGKHLLEAEANQRKIWTEEGFLKDIGTLDNWIWWENHVGEDVPLTKEGLVSLCFESRLHVPKVYVPITDVLLNNELKGHKEMAELQELVWHEDFQKGKPETKIYRHGSTVNLATLNHTLLHEISFSNCNITAAMSCLNLPELRKLNLERTNFQDFRLLTQLQNLHTLNLSQCEKLHTKDVESVFWPYLKRLYLSGSNFDRLDLLRGLASLESLALANCRHLEVPPCKRMGWTGMIDLDLSGSNFTDLFAIQKLPKVQAIDLSKCQHLSTRQMVEPFSWPSCETINLDHSNFDNLNLMSSMRELLYFSANHCSDIYTYSVGTFFWPSVEVLLFSHSNFDDMSLIQNLNTLETLDMSHCKDLQTRGFPLMFNLNLPRLKNMDLRGSAFDRLEILDTLPHLEYLRINGCPNLIITEENKLHWPNLKKLDLEMGLFMKLNVQSQFMDKLIDYVDKKQKILEDDTKNLRASLSAGSFPVTGSVPAASPIRSFVDTISERYLPSQEAFSEPDAYSCGNPNTVESLSGSARNSENMRVVFKKSQPKVSNDVKLQILPDSTEAEATNFSMNPSTHHASVLMQMESLDGFSERKSDTAELQELLKGNINEEMNVHNFVAQEMDSVSRDPIDAMDEVRATMDQLLATDKRSPRRSRSMVSKASDQSSSQRSTPKRKPEEIIRDPSPIVVIDIESNIEKAKVSNDNTVNEISFHRKTIHEDVDEKKSETEYSEEFAIGRSIAGKLPTMLDSIKSEETIEQELLTPEINSDIAIEEDYEIDFEEEYIPTVPCRYFQEGRCTRGDKCTFLHVEPNTVLPTNDVTKTKHCKFWRKGQCTKGNFCTFIHDPHSLMPLKTKVCKYHEAGLCLKGDHCTFVHVSQDKDAIIREIKSFVKLHQHGDKGALFVKLLQSMKFDHTRFGHKRAIDFVQTIPGIQIERKPQVELFLDEHDEFMKPRRQIQNIEPAPSSLASEGETVSTGAGVEDLTNSMMERRSPLPQPSSSNNFLPSFINNGPLQLGTDLHHEFRQPPPQARQPNYYPTMQATPFNFMMPFFSGVSSYNNEFEPSSLIHPTSAISNLQSNKPPRQNSTLSFKSTSKLDLGDTYLPETSM